ncbi:hypothetical protein CIW50_05065 [Tardiphaga sp. P9-11]|jgi:hypothetical protein|nr:hypothetical protein CIW50_05065 [Tardiphaga sp. P9-11]
MPTDDKATKSERDAAAKAVLDNMARLKAMRLAREAASPPAPAKKKATAKSGKTSSGKTSSGKTSSSKSAEKAQALAAWLADQRSGGRRT